MAKKEPPPASFGRYQVLEELGAGAMGVVYLCVDPQLSRPVAIKVLKDPEHLDEQEHEQYMARFFQEAQAAGRLNHPGIVQIYDIGQGYIVMEFIEGRTLSEILKGGTVLTVSDVCSLVLQVADAIDYAHKGGIVHRDIKPANIMLTEDGTAKVMDFGVARLETSTLTVAGTVMGSVRYMSPEQMMGERVDGRADVFALSIVAYEMLTGRSAFPGKTITEIVSRVVHGAFVPARQVNDWLPDALDRVFARAFAGRIFDRYQTATEFGRDLYEAAQPVLEVEMRQGVLETPPTQMESAQMTAAEMTAAEVPAEELRADEAIPETTMDAPLDSLLEPAEPAAAGILGVESVPPGARVRIDGRESGLTPLSLKLGLGSHEVELELAGHLLAVSEVELTAARPLRSLGFTLRKAVGSAGVRPGQLVAFGPRVEPPRRLGGELPAYPAAADGGLEGSPVVDLWVGPAGKVVNVAVVESAGRVLDEALTSTVAGWTFEPAKLDGVPVTVKLTCQHHFRKPD